MGDAIADIAELRGLLKDFMPKLSVRKGRGTGWGWLEIRGSAGNGHFTQSEMDGMAFIGLPHGANYCVISPEDRAFWLDKMRRFGQQRRA